MLRPGVIRGQAGWSKGAPTRVWLASQAILPTRRGGGLKREGVTSPSDSPPETVQLKIKRGIWDV